CGGAARTAPSACRPGRTRAACTRAPAARARRDGRSARAPAATTPGRAGRGWAVECGEGRPRAAGALRGSSGRALLTAVAGGVATAAFDALVHAFAQLLARAEQDAALGAHLDGLGGLRVPPRVALVFLHVEHTQAAHLDVLA